VANTSDARPALAERRRLGPTTVLGDVAETAIAQTTPRYPASRHTVREGEAVEASDAEMSGNLLGLRSRGQNHGEAQPWQMQVLPLVGVESHATHRRWG
jgi:hypothetical protein